VTTAQTREDPRASWETLGEEWEVGPIEQSLSVTYIHVKNSNISCTGSKCGPPRCQTVNTITLCNTMNCYKMTIKLRMDILLLAFVFADIQIRSQKTRNIS
jgi:hypothetical protein